MKVGKNIQYAHQIVDIWGKKGVKLHSTFTRGTHCQIVRIFQISL